LQIINPKIQKAMKNTELIPLQIEDKIIERMEKMMEEIIGHLKK
jgi:hypothetical protein